MPALTVCVDGGLLARVCTDGLDVLAINVGGTRVDDELATIHVNGGAYPEDGEHSHLIWIDRFVLQPGQQVQIELSDAGADSQPGMTIDQFPPEPNPTPPAEFKTLAQTVAELKERTLTREGYAFEAQLPAGEVQRTASLPNEHGFGFSVLWNSHRPERASVSLHTYTLDGLEHGEDGRDHARQYLRPGQSVGIKVEAQPSFQSIVKG